MATVACAFALTFTVPLAAQEQAGAAPESAAEGPAPDSVELADAGRLATAIADPAQRHATLLGLASTAQLQRRLGGRPPTDPALSARQWLGDRDWLDQLEARFGRLEPRSPVLDPAAWRMRLQLDQRGLAPTQLASESGPAIEVLLTQLFDRDRPALAAAALARVLWYLEAEGTLVWSDFLEGAAQHGLLITAMSLAGAEPFPGWNGEVEDESAAPVLPAPGSVEEAIDLLSVLVRELADFGPPDPYRVGLIRQGLLARMPELDASERFVASQLMHLAGMLHGLPRGDYFRFTEGSLAVVSKLERERGRFPAEVQRLAAWMAQTLPSVSESYARDFAAVDPRLNSAVAAAYDVALALSRSDAAPDAPELRRELADATARLALLVPDIGFYFDLPVRDLVAGGVDACMATVAERHPDGGPAMTRELFDDCQESLVGMADDAARQAQLAGDPDGPFGESQLERELTLTTGQRINYGIGYLHDRYDTGCEPPPRALPNPIEWAFLATFMTWIAEQSPVFFQTPENEQRLNRMRAIGEELVRTVSEQVDCIAGAGAGINDPVNRVTADYRERLAALRRGLESAESAFRSEVLAPGADIDLRLDARQPTAYRPGDLPIRPCDPDNICEMSGELSSTRALVGLFPEPYLVADQSALGSVEICYDDLGWEQRRSEPVRPGDENVANYYGRLAFTLKGRFRGAEDTAELFAYRFRSPEEYLYLFAASSAEVLDDACPVEWIGTRIVTELPAGRRAIVPNRLTYMSAPRTLPSRLLAANWDEGAEWRDWFVTGLGVDVIEMPPPPDLAPRLNQHLQRLQRREQDAIYGNLLRAMSPEGEVTELRELLSRLDNAKALIRMQALLFYPHVLTQSETLRAALTGSGGLLDAQVLSRLREEGLMAGEVLDLSFDRLDGFQQRWRSVPEAVRRTGSMADSVSQALIRLNALYARFFAGAAVRDGEAAAASATAAGEIGGGEEVDDGEGDEEPRAD